MHVPSFLQGAELHGSTVMAKMLSESLEDGNLEVLFSSSVIFVKQEDDKYLIFHIPNFYFCC